MTKELNTEVEKVSYALGMDVGFSFQSLPAEIDIDSLIQGISDISKGDTPLLNEQEFAAEMQQFQAQMQQKQQEMKAEAEGKNKEAGDAYLAENKEREGVTVTESGLQYEVLVEGDGEIPTADKSVTVHYTGMLIDGTVFDSSVERGEPATFPVNGVIQGWIEALQLMAEGSKFRLVIPSNLAYGERGAGQQIGPHSTLVFEVELLSVN